jgi:PAS domain S-box-containing protein
MNDELKSHSHLLAILDNMPYMAWHKDRNGFYLAVNQSFADACGKTKEEVIGKTDFEVWPRALAEKYTKDDAEVMGSGNSKTMEEPIDEQPGGIWVETYKSPVYDNQGQIIGTMGTAKDISNRKNYEIDLINQKNFIRTMIDSVPDFIFFKDTKGFYLGCNQSFADKIVGCSTEEIVGKKDKDFIRDPKLLTMIRQRDKDVLSQGKTMFHEITIHLLNGELVDLETCKTPFYNEKGEAQGVITIARNITDRKNTEAQLKAQREYAELLLRTVPSAVYSTDNNMIIRSWNTMAEKITGFLAEEVIGKSLGNLPIHPCRNNCQLYDDDEIIVPDTSIHSCIKNKKGETRYILKNVDVLMNDREESIGRIECFYDITDKVLIDNKLKESETRLNLAISSASIGMWDWNVQTNQVVFNEQWANMAGYTLKELEPLSIQTWIDMTHPEDLEKSMARLQDHFEGKTTQYEVEIRLKHKQGHWIWVIDRGTVIEWDADLKPLRMIGTHIDITKIKNTEKELKEAKLSAEAANNLKSQFIANISHEIRTPLHGVLGYASLLREHTETEQGLSYLDSIKKAGNTLLKLIDDILDLSKIEAGKMDLQIGHTDIRLLLDDIQSIFLLKSMEKNIVLQMKVDTKIPKSLMMDEVRIRQILFNLVGNAVKFTEKGYVNVFVKSLNYDEKKRTVDLLFEVKDSGIGIPAEQHETIFEPFKQKEGQNTKKYGGTGLGLSICKRLVQMMGGTITVESAAHQGAIFLVTMPNISIGRPYNIEIEEEKSNAENESSKPPLIASEEKRSKKHFPVKAEMVERLEGLKEDLWIECTTKNRVSDIRKFEETIRAIGTDFKHDVTIRYANSLQKYIRAFDLNNIKKLLEEYPKLIERYKSHMN